MKTIFFLCLLIFLVNCNQKSEMIADSDSSEINVLDSILFVDGFDFPVGKPDAKKYYNAQKFQQNNHLGDDWNGVNGGNSDLGDAVYSIAHGKVVFAKDIKGGWGNVVRIVHTFENGKQVESLYAHCDEIQVNAGEIVKKGDKIGTIGTAHGKYLAHLHFEIREKVGMPIGQGYSAETEGYLDPTKFIKENR